MSRTRILIKIYENKNGNLRQLNRRCKSQNQLPQKKKRQLKTKERQRLFFDWLPRKRNTKRKNINPTTKINMSNIQKRVTTKDFFNQEKVKQKFEELLGEKSAGFVSSVLQVTANNKALANA